MGFVKIALFFFLSVVTAAAAAPTLAILGDADAEALAELSKHPEVVLVERGELSLIALERALVEARDGALRPWQIAAADGLLLIEPTGDGFRARLFSTHNGLCVWQTTGRAGGESPWPLVAEEVVRAATKLRLTPQEVLPVGILGLWPATAHPEGAERARQLTRAVELRLTDSPGVVLLERRRLGDASFERALRENNSELARAARLLEGSFDVVNLRWEADVLVRGMDGTGNAVVRLDADTLEDMAGKIVSLISGFPSRDVVGVTEADAFVKEAMRAERARLDDHAIDLAETALALSGESDQLHALLARLHARLTGIEDPYDTDQQWLETPDEERPKLAQQRVEHAFLALSFLEKSERKNLPMVMNACSTLLRLLDRESIKTKDLELLRAKLRDLAPFDPTGTRKPYHLAYAADFAPTWAHSPEEVLAFHRSFLRSSHPQKHWLIKRLLGDPNLTLGQRFSDPEHKRRLMRSFVEEIIADPELEMLGLLLAAGIRDPEQDPAACQRYLKAFTERVSEVETSGLLPSLHDVESWMPEFAAADNARRLIAVLPKLQQYHHDFLSRNLFREYPVEYVPAIRAAFEEYARRMVENAPMEERTELTSWMAFHRKNFFQRNPSAVGEPPTSDAVVVRRYWPVPSVAGGKQRIIVEAFARRDEVWLSVIERGAKDNVFWRLTTPGLNARAYPVKDRHGAHAFVVDDDALYASYQWIPELVRVDAATGETDTRPMRKTYGIWKAGDCLAFSLWDAEGRDDENGLLVYDWTTGTEIIVGSSKRIPARTPFDEIAKGMISSVSSLTDGRLLVAQVANGLRLLAVHSESGEFEILPEGRNMQALIQTDGILLVDYRGEVWHHDGRELAHWMSRKDGARWNTPADWSEQAPGKRQIAAADGKLFFLNRSLDGSYVLRMFQPGGPPEGRTFTLRFENAEAGNLELERFEPHLFATASGLLFQPHMDGVWFLPFADLPVP